MSHKSQSNATSLDTNTEALEIIREEQGSPTTSSVRITASKATAEDLLKCICRKYDEAVKEQIDLDKLDEILKEKEAELRADYDKILAREKELIKERFDFILINEQTRASYMLREAHRERQEKINALQSQLQCKNLAALMYVMCTERRRSRLEKLRIIRDYNAYIEVLQNILTEGQDLILHLSRGYKTAARVDHEWREKMKKIVGEFLSFIYHFAGGTPETNQYMLDLPKLLKIDTPVVDDPHEDPCEEEEEGEGQEGAEENPVFEEPHETSWWERLTDEPRPFVMYGDMAEFNPKQRKEVLTHLKAPKTAPKRWQQYVFRDMFFNNKCSNLNKIKDLYLEKLPVPVKWECSYSPVNDRDSNMKGNSKQSIGNIFRGNSVDIRGNMGSILKIIASVPNGPVSAKTELLGARDSMELTSTTKLKERISIKPPEHVEVDEKDTVINIGKKRLSVFDVQDEEETVEPVAAEPVHQEDEIVDESMSQLGSIHNDSLSVIQTHVPEADHKINYERVCPMEKCQRLQVDSFMRSLPPYMRANPFTHFEQTFDQYETCTPEQLEMLKQRIENKKVKEEEELSIESSPLSEWVGRGVACQTSNLSLDLPPCECYVPSPTPVSSNYTFNLQDLMPVKHAMDAIHRECLYDDNINFNRFKLIGQDSRAQVKEEEPKQEPKQDFMKTRYDEIKKILKQHPSLLDIFQANTK
ncbi:uncharacterized protein LOC124641971 [Helicoverpa zea]|nr:uncharacterized protein LOC124641971 [Helicoverpa zea]